MYKVYSFVKNEIGLCTNSNGFILSEKEAREIISCLFNHIDKFDIEEENKNLLSSLMQQENNFNNINDESEYYLSDKKGFLYFVMSETGHFKIGRTSNLKSRLKSLRSASPYELNLYKFKEFDDCFSKEEEIHEYFKDFRVNSEWFKITKQQIDFLFKKERW